MSLDDYLARPYDDWPSGEMDTTTPAFWRDFNRFLAESDAHAAAFVDKWRSSGLERDQRLVAKADQILAERRKVVA